MFNKNKILAGAFSLLLALLAVIFYQGGFAATESVADTGTQIKSDRAVVRFLDVGQGDAILISLPDSTDILIDGGPDKKILEKLGENMPFWDKKIEVMILTHPHADHVGGLVEVLRRYQVDQIYYTGALHTAPDYIAWLKEIKKQDIPMAIVDSEFALNFEDPQASLTFLYPRKSIQNKKFSNLNDSSMVVRFQYGEKKFLFMSDLETKGESELIKAKVNLKADVLKIGHHGSKSSSFESFLKKVAPKYAVIFAGVKNSFGHPHLITIRRLEKLKYGILRTDLLGTITLVTDGKTIYKK
jgi:competence protein ComEC